MLCEDAVPFRVHICWQGTVATATVTGEPDLSTAPRLAGRLQPVIAAQPERLVLDLHALAFVDVAGPRAIAAVREAVAGDCPVIVRQPRPLARKVLAIAGVIPAN